MGTKKKIGYEQIWVRKKWVRKNMWVQWVHVKVLAWRTPDGEKTLHDTMSLL